MFIVLKLSGFIERIQQQEGKEKVLTCSSGKLSANNHRALQKNANNHCVLQKSANIHCAEKCK